MAEWTRHRTSVWTHRRPRQGWASCELWTLGDNDGHDVSPWVIGGHKCTSGGWWWWGSHAGVGAGGIWKNLNSAVTFSTILKSNSSYPAAGGESVPGLSLRAAPMEMPLDIWWARGRENVEKCTFFRKCHQPVQGRSQKRHVNSTFKACSGVRTKCLWRAEGKRRSSRRWFPVGNILGVGNVAQPPLGKASGERCWQAGPTPMDRFSRGDSGLRCTLTAMRLALAKTPSPWIEVANVYWVSLTS